MKTQIKQIKIPKGKRILAVSDIHGEYESFKGLLHKTGFSKDDILIIVGDIIEKGEESLKTLRYIMDLSKTHIVYITSGNVEKKRIQVLEGSKEDGGKEFFQYLCRVKSYWGRSLFLDMLKEQGMELIEGRSPMDYVNCLEQYYSSELTFLKNLPDVIETDRFIFVHGGLPSADLKEVEQMEGIRCLKNDAFLEQDLCFSKCLVVGHWPVVLYQTKLAQCNPIYSQEQNIIAIDGGSGLKRMGQLNCLIIPDEEARVGTYRQTYGTRDIILRNVPDAISFESMEKFPSAKALHAQIPEQEPVYISWLDSEIRILEEREKISYVEHLSSKRCIWMENEDIKFEDGVYHCWDYPDYQLPVSPGDEIFIIKKYIDRYLIKKDGICGWYKGEIEYN